MSDAATTTHQTTATASSGRALLVPEGPPIGPEAFGGVSACHVATLDPASIAGWTRYVLTHPEGTLFHTAAWRAAVAHAFGHQSAYLIARRRARVVGLLPLFLVPSRFGGRMLVSVPYGVGGGIIADDGQAATRLFDRARQIAEEERCSVIDLRHDRAVAPDVPIDERYVGFRRELPDRAEDVLDWLPRKARAAARNGRKKYRLTVEFGDEHLAEVWRLYTVSMRRLGSLSYPLTFFRALVDRMPNRHWVLLVRWNGRAVAGLVTFLFRDSVMPYFFGASGRASRCSAANFTYLTVMERAAAEGYRVFDFGRSRRDNVGSVNFKRFNGFEPRVLQYQRYIPLGRTYVDLSSGARRFRLVRRVWPWLPLTVTRTLGARMAQHIPG